ncbi:hypothetical protein lerEdw1_009568 [Lerista edwardsae]|nr:hypothetical protein lerEdw1_009568 [Lerista edwardsae]
MIPPDTLRATRILMSISIIGGLVAVSLAFLTNTSGNDPKWPLITNLATGLLALATMLLFGLSNLYKVASADSDVDLRHPIHFSWAYILGCLAASCFLLSALLYILIMLQDIIKIRTKSRVVLRKMEQPLPPV